MVLLAQFPYSNYIDTSDPCTCTFNVCTKLTFLLFNVGICLAASALSLFLILIPATSITISLEAFNVLILSLFNGISNGCWNTMSLITTEIYPTYLRTTAGAVGLASVRIGAILGLILFGHFVDVSLIVPILMVASVMAFGAVLSIFLPKTTKRTRLE
jgi:hypothetical protein